MLVAQLLVELSGGLHRHGLAEQHVTAGGSVCQGIHKWLMEYHHPLAAGVCHHLLNQGHTGQGLGDDTKRLAVWQHGHQRLTVGGQPRVVNQHQGAPRAVFFQRVIDLQEIGGMGGTPVIRS